MDDGGLSESDSRFLNEVRQNMIERLSENKINELQKEVYLLLDALDDMLVERTLEDYPMSTHMELAVDKAKAAIKKVRGGEQWAKRMRNERVLTKDVLKK